MLRTLFFAALALVTPALALAQVAVLPVEATNLTDGEAAAIGAVVADAYARASGSAVLAPAQAGEASGAVESVRCRAVRLAVKITLSCERFDAAGTKIFRAEMTAASLDDMAVAATRVARALVELKAPEEVRDHRTVTREESGERNRTFVEKVMGIKGSVTAVVASGVRYDPAVSLQFDGRLEADRYFIEFGAGLMLPGHGDERGFGALFAEIGGSRYLTDGEIAPYIGAGISPRIAFDSVDGGVGVAPYLQGGVMLMRSSSSRLYVDLRVSQNIMAFDKRDTGYYDDVSGEYVDDPNDDVVYPTEIGLFFGVGW